MSRGQVVIPVEMQADVLTEVIQEKHTLSLRYNEIQDKIAEVKKLYRVERTRIQLLSQRKERKVNFIIAGRILDETLQPLFQEKARVRKELGDISTFLKMKHLERVNEVRDGTRLSRKVQHEQYVANLQRLLDLPAGESGPLLARSLVVLTRLKDEGHLSTEECQLISLIDKYIRADMNV